MRSYPLSFVLGGYYVWTNGTILNQGARALYWTDTIYNASESQIFEINSTRVSINNDGTKAISRPVRCKLGLGKLTKRETMCLCIFMVWINC